jgi:1-acyl-sn-glycerol-3-phosphate acyltransferase
VESSALELALRPLLLAAIAGAARVFMTGLNSTTVSGSQLLAQAVLQRPEGQGLLTVSNHVGAMDDPLVLAAALPPAALLSPSALRWTLCATDRCFVHPLVDSFFRAGKVLPLQRGAGLQQPGLAAAEARLAAGDWIHLFPEGTRSQTGTLGRVRPGVGRLYAAAWAQSAERTPGAPPPLILPFVHAGMERVNPRGTARLHAGQHVRVLVGEPMDLSPLVEGACVRTRASVRTQLLAVTQLTPWLPCAAHEASGAAPEVLYAAVAAHVEAALHALHAQLHAPDASTPAAPALASVAGMPLPARLPLASRLLDWASNSPASRDMGRHHSPAGFTAARAWGARMAAAL